MIFEVKMIGDIVLETQYNCGTYPEYSEFLEPRNRSTRPGHIRNSKWR